jgi:hypothetical protein
MRSLQEIEDLRPFWAAWQKHLNADGDDVKGVDSGFGDARYKQVLGSCEWTEASVHIFAPSGKALGLSFLRTLPIIVDKCVKALLARTNCFRGSRESGEPTRSASKSASLFHSHREQLVQAHRNEASQA